MKKPAIISYQPWIKQIALILAFLLLAFSGYFSLTFLSRIESTPEMSGYLSLILFSFLIPMILSWFGFRLLCIFLFVPLSLVFVLLISWVTHSSTYLIFILAQGILCFLLFYLDQRKEAEMIVYDVEIEKSVNEKNDLELAFKEEGMSISVYFEKYASYYNLRNLASDFSTTLALKELTQMIVAKTMGLISRSNWCLLFLADSVTGVLSLVASKRLEEDKKKQKSGDLFDLWVVRNRQSLIVTDTQKDFRFDLAKIPPADDIRSVLVSPLIHERKIVGTLKCHSPKPGAFNTDDLRLLEAVSTLASSAVSNCILFQKTEDLAIRDSLTGLFVYRYFMERLIAEHGRSLLTHAPLTLLMCDLDHFKVCNDRYGHGVGDYILKQIADTITKKVTDGIVARYGGEEFAILLPKQSIEEGRALAEELKSTIEGLNISVRREVIPVTLSIGVAAIPNDTLDAEELIRIADRRLYQAKNSGRNQICGID